MGQLGGMRDRPPWRRLGNLAFGILLTAVCCAPPLATAQLRLDPARETAATSQTMKRTVKARASIDGVWAANFIIFLEPTARTPELVVSEAEAKVIAEDLGSAIINRTSLDFEVPEYLKSSDGLPIVRGQRRTRAIVQPSDGRLPYTAAAQKELEAGVPVAVDNPEQRPSAERCLANRAAQPPMTSLLFAGPRLQIVQTADVVVLRVVDDVRIVRLTEAHGPRALRQWLGDSIGRWEGSTLVIETVGLPDSERRRLFPSLIVSSEATVVERLTPLSDRELLYQFTVLDPKTYSGPWLGEFSWYRTEQPLFEEYACHEGNYSLPNILSGARHEEQMAAGVAPAR